MSRVPIRVLIVDDSAVVRAAIARILDRCPEIEVVGTTLDGILAQRKTLKLQPDVITLDVDMPRMDGFAFLEWLRENRPTPTIVVSGALTERGQDLVLDLLAAGATDIVRKPNGSAQGIEEVSRSLVEKVKAATRARPWSRARAVRGVEERKTPPPAITVPGYDLIAIGASTGGPVALTSVLSQLPASSPPILVVQHMPADFIPRLASRLDGLCAMRVAEARQGARLEQGLVLISPGDQHMGLRRSSGGYRVVLEQGPKRHHQRPSVDVLFEDVARVARGRCCGVLMTGMGRDGAAGLLAMRQAGARTIVQDEETSVVFGMGGEAVRLGAAESVLPLEHIAAGLARPRRVASQFVRRKP